LWLLGKMELNPETAAFTKTAALANSQFSTMECFNRYMCSIYLYYSLLLKWPRHFSGPRSFNAEWLPDWCIWMPFPFRFLFMLCIPVPLNAVKSFFSPIVGHDPKEVEQAQGKFGQAAGGIINKGLHYMYKDLAEALVWAISGFGRRINGGWFHKDVWRGILPFAGCTVPPCVGRWSHEKQAVKWLLPLPDADLIVKPVWGGLGVGDFSLKCGGDWNQHDAEQKIKAGTQQVVAAGGFMPIKDFLILKRVQPDPSLGVHCFEILTVLTSNDRVVTARLAMYCSSSSWSSHGSMNFFVVDPETEAICCPEQWLKIRQGWPAPGPDMLGRKIPGVKAICRQAEAAHKVMISASRTSPKVAAMKEEHLRVIGWDAMMAEDGKAVWFEGNMPLLRLSRCLCSSWATMFQYRDVLDFN